MSLSKKLLRPIPFLKMHGLGNDFVILDARTTNINMTPKLARAIGNRHFGVGFDQLVLLTQSKSADIHMTFWNIDGSLSAACGNASRCVAQLLMAEMDKPQVSLQTDTTTLIARKTDEGLISVNMGLPVLEWQDIPLAYPQDLNALDISGQPGAVGMGNPHCVFVVEDADHVNLIQEGEKYQCHPLFPERTNVEFIHIIDKNTIRQRTYERGVGVTLACGSGACAAAVVAHRKGLTEPDVSIKLDGGILRISWRDDGIWMIGATQYVFMGELSSDFLQAVQ